MADCTLQQRLRHFLPAGVVSVTVHSHWAR